MTADKSKPDSETLNANFAKIEELSARLMTLMGNHGDKMMGEILPNQELMGKAMTAYFTDMMKNPTKMFEMQVGQWKDTVENFAKAQTGAQADEKAKGRPDRRFANEQWQSNPFFAYMKDQYVSMSEKANESVQGLSGLSDKDQKRLKFYTQQFTDLMAPTNFLATNPDALERAVETNGQSLVQGLENLVRDLEANNGKFAVSLTDNSAFKVGENVASTPGKVVFQNRMFQLIQYTPTTEEVYETPLLVVPPCINKYYILDLHEKNSFMKYAVEQGQSVFIISWVNPDASYADVDFEDYAFEGILTALVQIIKISGSEKVNALGFCIGGTLLACTLAWLAKKGMTPVNSATFLTTLIDFEDAGELEMLITDETMRTLEADVKRTGLLEAQKLGQVFSYLRAKDLVYGPAIKSYMLGEAPPAFDLLYWNQDTPHLPGTMALNYLRNFYVDNKFVKGELEFGGETLNVKDITMPIYSIAARTDHIVPWQCSHKGVSQFGSKSARFILSGSGHIAGVINPPAANKYGYVTNPARPDDVDLWEANAKAHEGSWWTDWTKWMARRSGNKIPASPVGGPDHKPIEDAPGSYVTKETSF